MLSKHSWFEIIRGQRIALLRREIGEHSPDGAPLIDQLDDATQMTALHLAVESLWYEGVDELLAAGADPNTTEPTRGRTPLHSAAAHGGWDAAELVQRLLVARADPRRADFRGATPLSGDPGLERLLVTRGSESAESPREIAYEARKRLVDELRGLSRFDLLLVLQDALRQPRASGVGQLVVASVHGSQVGAHRGKPLLRASRVLILGLPNIAEIDRAREWDSDGCEYGWCESCTLGSQHTPQLVAPSKHAICPFCGAPFQLT